MAQIKSTFVIASDGARLDPMTNVKKVRTYLRTGKAVIYKCKPFFTIKLTYIPENIIAERKKASEPESCIDGKPTSAVKDEDNCSAREISMDTGSEHIGLSVKSKKHEYLSEQRDNLDDEKSAHDAQVKTRRARRNRKRYRAPRFDNRKRDNGWLAPSLEHKKDNHLYLLEELLKVFPATDIWLEMGSFDTQALAAIETGKPMPEGRDYQQGPRYQHDTLREAVFYRDGYKCLVCGKSAITDHVSLKIHHIGFRENDHSDRMSNLATVCEHCHIPKNHKPGGALWDFKPDLKPLKDAAFMNSVRWNMYQEAKDIAGQYGAKVHMTYGSVTKRTRKDRNLPKSHAIDAYCIGKLHPKHRANTFFYQKKRRNNRCLQKFYDAVYVDSRDGEEKKAAQLGCNRDNRKHPRNWNKNERPFRGRKVSKGSVSIRRRRYDIRPGDPLLYTWTETVNGKPVQKSKRIISAGVHSNGERVTYKGARVLPLSEVIQAQRKNGTFIPLEPGNKCLYVGGCKKKPKPVTILAKDKDTVTIRWTYSVRIDQVRQLSYTSGWENYIPADKYIYKN